MYNKKILEINNPVLKKGEFVVVHDNLDGGADEQYIKIGDGATPFNDLPYGVPKGGFDVSAYISSGPGGTKLNIDKTFSEIHTAISNGENVRFFHKETRNNVIQYFGFVTHATKSEISFLLFYGPHKIGAAGDTTYTTDVTIYNCCIDSSNVTSFATTTLSFT